MRTLLCRLAPMMYGAVYTWLGHLVGQCRPPHGHWAPGPVGQAPWACTHSHELGHSIALSSRHCRIRYLAWYFHTTTASGLKLIRSWVLFVSFGSDSNSSSSSSGSSSRRSCSSGKLIVLHARSYSDFVFLSSSFFFFFLLLRSHSATYTDTCVTILFTLSLFRSRAIEKGGWNFSVGESRMSGPVKRLAATPNDWRAFRHVWHVIGRGIGTGHAHYWAVVWQHLSRDLNWVTSAMSDRVCDTSILPTALSLLWLCMAKNKRAFYSTRRNTRDTGKASLWKGKKENLGRFVSRWGLAVRR